MFWSLSGKFLFWHIFQGPLWHNFPDLKFTGPRVKNTFDSMSLHLIFIPVTAHLLLIYILFVPTSLPWKPYSLSQKVTLHLHFCLFHMVILVFSHGGTFSWFTCWFLFFSLAGIFCLFTRLCRRQCPHFPHFSLPSLLSDLSTPFLPSPQLPSSEGKNNWSSSLKMFT